MTHYLNILNIKLYFCPTTPCSSGKVTSTQSGVVRTNCIDCLDRTNVVQGLIARYVLTHQLRQMGVLGQGDEIPTSSQFE